MSTGPSPKPSAFRTDAGGSACGPLSEPLAQVMTMLGKRWTGLILGTLMPGPVFYSDLKRGVPGISDRILSERLVELGELHLVMRTVLTGPPTRVRYELTEHGVAMRPALAELARWAEQHLT